ncbi:MAG: competence/damage-inducible protein A [Firmicutes bacterium]|nr:competence/damage-inducible protein A [Bacillota bacterium]
MIEINRAEILCVGTEILIGDIINTNAAYISKRLAELGFNQYYQHVVGDNPDRLKSALNASLERCDLLVMTGGLGPTYDDLTKECVAEALGRKMYLHSESFERIKQFFSCRKITMPETNKKQAMVPEGAVVFKNDNGTAPGIGVIDEKSGKVIILLPGPPREMAPMFDNEVMPFLRSYSKSTLVSKNINITGLGESGVEILIRDHIRKADNPTVAPYCKEGEVRLRVTARAKTREEGLELCEKEIDFIRQTEVGKYIYGIDTDLEHAVVSALKERKATLSLAESCTGGLISKRITDVPGCSEVFLSGAVTYSNEMKISMLKVKKETLDTFGAVSEECAKEMAEGIRSVSGSTYGASVTGIAGPEGGNSQKPVGLVWIAVSRPDNVTVTRKLNLNGSREHIRLLSSTNVLALVLEQLIK